MSDRSLPPAARPQRPSQRHPMPRPQNLQVTPPPSRHTQSFESFASRPLSVDQPQPAPQIHSTASHSQPAHQSARPYQTQQGYAIPQPSQSKPLNPSAMQTMQGYAQAQPRSPQSNAPHSDFGDQEKTEIKGGLPPVSSQKIQRGKLTATEGEHTGSVWFLNREVTHLGRGLDNDIILHDIAASRRHLTLNRHLDGFSLFDLKSANGTYLNQTRITEEEIYDGDIIELGETHLLFESIGEARQRLDASSTSPGTESIPLTPVPASQMIQGQFGERVKPEDAASPSNYQLTLNSSAAREVSRQERLIDSIYDLWESVIYHPNSMLSRCFQALSLIVLLGLSLWLGRYLAELKSIDVKALKMEVERLIESQKITEAREILKTASNQLTIEDRTLLQSLIKSERSIQDALAQAETSVASSQWIDAIKFLQQIPVEHKLFKLTSPLLATAQNGLLSQRALKVRESLWRGLLNEANSHLEEVNLWVPLDKQSILRPLRFAVWIHAEALGEQAIDLSPPPSEQRALEEAAQYAQSNPKLALVALNRSRPQTPARKTLFELRKKSLASRRKKRRRMNSALKKKDPSQILYLKSLDYLLGTQNSLGSMLEEYRLAIRKSIESRKYTRLAPWLKASLIIAPDDQELKRLKLQLQAEAIKWFQLGLNEQSNREDEQAKAYFEAAEPYLLDAKRIEVRRLIDELR